MIWENVNPPYRTIVADPPWDVIYRIGKGGRRARDTRKAYSTMTLEEIAELPIHELVDGPAALFLWVVPKLHAQGVGVQMALKWGFTVSGEIIWSKPNLGMGAFPRTSHEVLLICSRGTGVFADAPRDVHSVQTWNQVYGANNTGKVHSAKPPASYDLIERSSYGPYLELFARQPRLGWDHWGLGVESVA